MSLYKTFRESQIEAFGRTSLCVFKRETICKKRGNSERGGKYLVDNKQNLQEIKVEQGNTHMAG